MLFVMALVILVFLILFIAAMGFVNILIKLYNLEKNNTDEEKKRD